MKRVDGRAYDEMRPIRIIPGYQDFAEGSALIEIGKTRVLCSASVEEKVPFFLLLESTESKIPRAIGNIIAVVAVLLIHMERNVAVSPRAKRILIFLWAIDFIERIE